MKYLIIFLIYTNSIFAAEEADINCGVEEAKKIIEKIYTCPSGVPDLDVLFLKEDIRAELNYLCYLCKHKTPKDTQSKKDQRKLCDSFYVEVFERLNSLNLVLSSGRCTKILDVYEETKNPQISKLKDCEYLEKKAFKIGSDKDITYLCVGKIICPKAGPKGTPLISGVHCTYDVKNTSAKEIDCPALPVCAYDIGSLKEVSEIKDQEVSNLEAEYSDYQLNFKPIEK